MLQLVKVAQKMGWDINASLSMVGVSSVTLLAPNPGQAKPTKIVLCDSLKVLQSTVEQIGKGFQTAHQKLFDDYSTDMRKLPLKKLRAGCLNDCHVIREALDIVQALFEERGGRLRKTFSSSALTLIQASLKEQGIKLPRHKTGTAYAKVNEEIMRYNMGGRVEVLHHMPQGLQEKWDVPSSYPWSMTQRLPMTWTETVKGKAAVKSYADETQEGMFYASVQVPNIWLPPLPYRSEKGGIFFPWGNWASLFPAPELRYAESQGVKVRIHYAHLFTSGTPLKKFVDDFYPLKRYGVGAKREFGKLTMNGGYGKFGERPDREKLIVASDEAEAWSMSDDDKSLRFVDLSNPCLLGKKYIRWAPHAHFAIACYIRAYSRMLIHRYMMRATGLSYVDTDGIHCTSWDGESSQELGAFKKELEGFICENYAPKIYRYLHPDTREVLRDQKGKAYIASKGFPKADASDFERIIASARAFNRTRDAGGTLQDAKRAAQSEGVHLIRTRLFKSMMQSATPEQVLREREVRTWMGRSMKRKPHPDGSTSPWSVVDLRRGRHLKALSPLVQKSGGHGE